MHIMHACACKNLKNGGSILRIPEMYIYIDQIALLARLSPIKILIKITPFGRGHAFDRKNQVEEDLERSNIYMSFSTSTIIINEDCRLFSITQFECSPDGGRVTCWPLDRVFRQ